MEYTGEIRKLKIKERIPELSQVRRPRIAQANLSFKLKITILDILYWTTREAVLKTDSNAKVVKVQASSPALNEQVTPK